MFSPPPHPPRRRLGNAYETRFGGTFSSRKKCFYKGHSDGCILVSYCNKQNKIKLSNIIWGGIRITVVSSDLSNYRREIGLVFYNGNKEECVWGQVLSELPPILANLSVKVNRDYIDQMIIRARP